MHFAPFISRAGEARGPGCDGETALRRTVVSRISVDLHGACGHRDDHGVLSLDLVLADLPVTGLQPGESLLDIDAVRVSCEGRNGSVEVAGLEVAGTDTAG